MEATHLLRSKGLFLTLQEPQQRHIHILKKPYSTTVSVLTRSADKIIIQRDAKIREENTSSVYNDNWFDRIAIHHLSQSVQAATGLSHHSCCL